MGRRIDTYDPDTLKLLARAFDAAWVDVKRDEVSAQAEDRRTRLALIIFALAREGSRSATLESVQCGSSGRRPCSTLLAANGGRTRVHGATGGVGSL